MLHRNVQKLDPREQHYWIESPRQGMQLFLRYLPPLTRRTGEVRPVLYVHGATFPSALSIAHRFDGYSWRDALCEAGFDVWGFDFHGYGYSDRYPAMNEAPQANPPLCRTQDASEQLEAVVRFILSWHGLPSLSLISHSWGSMPAGRFAGRHPTMVDRMVLFGAIARRPPRRYEKPPAAPAWRIVTVEDQWARFVEDVPPHEQPVLSRAHFDEWSERYLDSDPDSRNRDPAGVKTPTGPFTDILHAWHGDLAYTPALVQAPVAIIRGEWDGLIGDEDARWLFDAFTASPIKRDIKISRATHLMHLEAMRYALYRESIAFLAGNDEASMRQLDAKRSQPVQQQTGGPFMSTQQEQNKFPVTSGNLGRTSMKKEVIRVEPLSTYLENWKAPTSAVTRSGDTIYVSGFPPFDPDTGKVIEAPIERQTELVLAQMKLCLETAGSSLENVLKCNVYCTSVEKFAAINTIYARYFPKDPPARIFVCIPAWPGPFDIEVDCIAVRKDPSE